MGLSSRSGSHKGHDHQALVRLLVEGSTFAKLHHFTLDKLVRHQGQLGYMVIRSEELRQFMLVVYCGELIIGRLTQRQIDEYNNLGKPK